jgi:hypothetical protein
VTGLLTGHCHLKGLLFKMGLTESPTCERCLEKDESATHILCDCEAIAYLRFRYEVWKSLSTYLGKLFRIPWMTRYEFLEPLKPIVYCWFVQSCNKRVNTVLSIACLCIILSSSY